MNKLAKKLNNVAQLVFKIIPKMVNKLKKLNKVKLDALVNLTKLVEDFNAVTLERNVNKLIKQNKMVKVNGNM